ncbi:MAG TPA: hypothetical protein DCG12_22735, partial [Planctomycetaceae bacterium]|nr:hypothetical protein [Planctomycetaceae bacterium]
MNRRWCMASSADNSCWKLWLKMLVGFVLIAPALFADDLESDSDEPALTKQDRDFWSFRPVGTVELPPGEFPEWQRNTIDRFIGAALKKRELNPAEQADALQLIRRLCLDVTGLPPTADDLNLADSLSDQQYSDLVNDVLDRPGYGEHWGQHWLDLVRYADTAGDASDYPIPEAWKYRNWVIDAFNKDKPYDSFVQEQIAGDLLPATDERASWQQQIATGYLAISRRVGVSPRGKPHIVIEDTLDNLGKTFLGLTVGCARCHD